MERKYIEREEILKLFEGFKRSETLSVAVLKDVIKTRPAADVVPVAHSEWQSNETEERAGWVHCPKCGWRLPNKYAKNFCGDCGADMRQRCE